MFDFSNEVININNIKLPMDELRISITSRCNMQCIYCHNEGNKIISDLDINMLDKLIDIGIKYGLKKVRLTGGEPLLHNDIENICKMIKSKDKNIKIGINTNCILIDKLCNLIDNGLIDRVVIGIDYFNNNISKNSPVGKSSSEILSNILKLKKYNIDISISTVYNGNYENIKNLVDWAINNNIRIKILEVVNDEISNKSSIEYLSMQKRIIDEFNLDIKIDDLLHEKHGYINSKRVLSFFHSHCRLRECNYCKNMHLRVMSTLKFKPCLLNDKTEEAFCDDNIEKKLIRSLNNLGVPPNKN